MISRACLGNIIQQNPVDPLRLLSSCMAVDHALTHRRLACKTWSSCFAPIAFQTQTCNGVGAFDISEVWNQSFHSDRSPRPLKTVDTRILDAVINVCSSKVGGVVLCFEVTYFRNYYVWKIWSPIFFSTVRSKSWGENRRTSQPSVGQSWSDPGAGNSVNKPWYESFVSWSELPLKE